MNLEDYDEKTRQLIQTLTPALRRHVCTINGILWAHSPFLIKWLADSDPEELNKIFRLKSRRAKEYVANIRFDPWAYLYLTERPYRLAAFRKIRNRISDAQYWRCLADVWQDAEYVHYDIPVWLSLFQSKRRYRPLLARRADRHYLRKLPKVLTVYRGYQHGKYNHKMGLSWTLSEEKAVWFACRRPENGAPRVVKAQCNKADVFCYLDDRHEQEIIINPKYVTGVAMLKNLGPLPSIM